MTLRPFVPIQSSRKPRQTDNDNSNSNDWKIKKKTTYKMLKLLLLLLPALAAANTQPTFVHPAQAAAAAEHRNMQARSGFG